MFYNYLKIAFRSFAKHKGYTLINLFGLATGLTLFFLIAVWVRHELTYDAAVPHRERVFRLEATVRPADGNLMNLSSVGWPVGEILKNQYPEVEKLTYVKQWAPLLVKKEGNYVSENALMADEHFFDVLGYPLAQGDAATALQKPFSLVLTQALARKYFGQANPLGQVLMVNDTLPYQITGVLAELPPNNHLAFDGLISLATVCAMFPADCKYEYSEGWFDLNVYNYARLKPSVNPEAFGQKIKDLVGERAAEAVKKVGMSYTMQLRPVGDVYLHSGMSTAGGPVGSARSVYFFGGIGALILLIASFNFINLATARAVERAKEVGVRKVLGSHRQALVAQFLAEALLLCVGAGALALAAAGLALPLFNDFAGKQFSLGQLWSVGHLALLAGLVTVVAVLTGFYPALVLSGYEPVTVLKGRFSHSAKGVWLRQGLVVVQLCISLGLIISTLAVVLQVRHLQSQPLGFDKDRVVVVDLKGLPWRLANGKSGLLTDELRRQPSAQSVAASAATPGRSGWDGQMARAEGATQDQGLLVEHIPVDAHYLPTLGLQVVAGRGFVPGSQADEQVAFVINEAASRAFGWATPAEAVGKKLSVSGVDGQVIGVVKNYHQHGLQKLVNPVVMNVMAAYGSVGVRYRGDAQTALAQLQATWQKVFPNFTFQYYFLDQDFQRQYAKEEKLYRAFTGAAGLAIGLALLGLLGLSTYTVRQKVKEIGIRKVLGASRWQVTGLLTQGLLRLIGVALLVVAPLAYYLLDRWLADFAYRTALPWWLFAGAGGLVVALTLLTVGWQSLRAAQANPADSLRSE
jgi:putative ABC transport system permease protein